MKNVIPYLAHPKSTALWLFLCGFFATAIVASSLKGQGVAPSPFWRNYIEIPGDPFRVLGTSPGDPDWIKFTILVEDPETVYFQDSQEYTFHYEFALEEMEAFAGMTAQEFSRYSLLAQGQRAILGAVILPPSNSHPALDTLEYGIQFIRLDAFAREEIVTLFQTVQDSVVAEPTAQVFYFPSYEQQEVARTNEEWFTSQGVPVSSSARWTRGNVCYAPGWALGRLTYVPGPEIGAAYRSGYLSPRDILLTDGVPADIPRMAGVLSLTPSTPNSHVAILCRNYGIPFAYLSQDEDVVRTRDLEGHTIVLRVYYHLDACDLRVIDVEGSLEQAAIDGILALHEAPALNIQPMATYGAAACSTDDLDPSDIRFFGGKAANLGILRRAIPDHSPGAIAFSFDIWNAFLDQCYLATDRTLREVIDTRLSAYRDYPPPNMASLTDELEGIRELFENGQATRFSAELEEAILQVLAAPEYGFEVDRRLRFRSSTNMEDSAQFTGAGLYDSFSGCLMDDLDDDDRGPCECDPSRVKERGVLRAIRKVFGSFYNDHAYLERIRHRVREGNVGMALLVHHSFPDEIELANGVATVMPENGSDWNVNLVTQAGALSVTNPTDGSVPEEVRVCVSPTGTYPVFVQGSNALPLGNRVMTWPDDYITLSKLIARVAEQYKLETDKSDCVLDLEYKKIAPQGELIVKQVREIPQLDTVPRIVPYLVQDVNRASEYCVYQGAYGDVFANHRLKSRWQFRTRNQWLDPKRLNGSIYEDVTFEYVRDGQIHALTGAPSGWPEYHFMYSDHKTEDAWAFKTELRRQVYRLTTRSAGELVASSESAILTLGDLGLDHQSCLKVLELSVDYSWPVLSWSPGDDVPSTTDRETVLLCPSSGSRDGEIRQERTFADAGRMTIKVSFYWPRVPAKPATGYTAPLARWHETLIEGVTSEPIVLRGYYSQTYHAGHHNVVEQFLFEPRLEPGIDARSLDELRAQNVERIYCVRDSSQSHSQIFTIGFDDD